MSLIAQVRNWLESDKSVKRVAEDLELTSELILLVRMIFADGKLKPEELADFKRLCKGAFNIPDEDVGDVLRYLQEFGYETTAKDAANMFEGLSLERKKTLLAHMVSIARSDNEVHAGEVELIKSTANVLQLEAADMADVLQRVNELTAVPAS